MCVLNNPVYEPNVGLLFTYLCVALIKTFPHKNTDGHFKRLSSFLQINVVSPSLRNVTVNTADRNQKCKGGDNLKHCEEKPAKWSEIWR